MATRTFAAGSPKTSTEMSRVASVPGGTADDDDSPADNPRPGILAVVAMIADIMVIVATDTVAMVTVAFITLPRLWLLW